MTDPAFRPDAAGLARALELLADPPSGALAPALPAHLPEQGLGEALALESLAPWVLGRAARLDGPAAMAHMDPPTPWITWALAQWNARLNQNLLHPATAPFAREAEALVIGWLAPLFGMAGGHFCAGSTFANLTALWAARDAAGVRRVVASAGAHLSIRKSARLLGLDFTEVPVDAAGRLDGARLPRDLDGCCLVLTAGTTAAGAVDPLGLVGRADWTHVDAAWAGPLMLSPLHRHRLGGVEAADSVAVSAHKWLFQPKDSALILFREPGPAEAVMTFGGGYLAADSVGLAGSRGAAAIPLLGTLLAWGREGMAARIEAAMAAAAALHAGVERRPRWRRLGPPETGITLFRPADGVEADAAQARLPPGLLSLASLHQQRWLRAVAANPLVDVDQVLAALDAL